jgi:hypothetical protein
MAHGFRVQKTGTAITRGGCFFISFRLLLAKGSQKALKYRVFYSCLTDKHWPKAPPDALTSVASYSACRGGLTVDDGR